MTSLTELTNWGDFRPRAPLFNAGVILKNMHFPLYATESMALPVTHIGFFSSFPYFFCLIICFPIGFS